ncbi:MAG: alpha/beta hydrolase [Ilumatobacteraceae bacterium]
MSVPWDYADPTAGTLDIPVMRSTASSSEPRLGTIVFNPGGPGFPGTQVLNALSGYFGGLRDRFDIVSFDPRGTGGAQRVDCGIDPVALVALDQTGGSGSAAAQAWAAMATACRNKLGDHLRLVSSEETAKDVDLIRQALGVETIDWFGLSHGTRLGFEYLRQFPDRVRSMVLDGAVEPASTLEQRVHEAASAAESAIESLLGSCAGEIPCPLGTDPLDAFDTLAERLARQPLTSTDGHTVGLVALQVAAGSAASLPAFNSHSFIAALAADGAIQADQLLEVGSQNDVTGNDTADAYWTILCNDDAVSLDANAVAGLARELSVSAPRAGLAAVATYVAPCEACPAPTEPPVPTSITTEVPVLVIGSTGDPSTPYIWSQHMAAAISGARLLTRQGEGHTACFTTFLAGCTGTAIVNFFIDINATALPDNCPD